MKFERIYRGKRLDNGEWVEGFILAFTAGQINPRRCFILPFASSVRVELGLYTFGGFVEVDPETVGQCTGIPDKTGKKIFEGDIVVTPKYGVDNGKGQNYSGKDKFAVGYSDGTYTLENDRRQFCLRPDVDAVVCGNIYDNPELLEVKK